MARRLALTALFCGLAACQGRPVRIQGTLLAMDGGPSVGTDLILNGISVWQHFVTDTTGHYQVDLPADRIRYRDDDTGKVADVRFTILWDPTPASPSELLEAEFVVTDAGIELPTLFVWSGAWTLTSDAGDGSVEVGFRRYPPVGGQVLWMGAGVSSPDVMGLWSVTDQPDASVASPMVLSRYVLEDSSEVFARLTAIGGPSFVTVSAQTRLALPPGNTRPASRGARCSGLDWSGLQATCPITSGQMQIQGGSAPPHGADILISLDSPIVPIRLVLRSISAQAPVRVEVASLDGGSPDAGAWTLLAQVTGRDFYDLALDAGPPIDSLRLWTVDGGTLSIGQVSLF